MMEVETMTNWLRQTARVLRQTDGANIGQDLFVFLGNVIFPADILEVTTAASSSSSGRSTTCCPSVRSPLHGIRDLVMENSRHFHERARNIWFLVNLLRLHGFAAAASLSPLSSQSHTIASDRFVNFEINSVIVSSPPSSRGISAGTQRFVERVMTELKRDALANSRRIREFDDRILEAERDIVALGTEYDALLVRAHERYGAWVVVDEGAEGTTSGGGVMVSEERLLLLRQIDELSVSATRMAELLTRSDDTVRLAVQYKTVEMERAMTANENKLREEYENERNALSLEIHSMRVDRLSKIDQLLDIASRIEEIVTGVRDVITDLTARLIRLLDRRKKSVREQLQRDVETRKRSLSTLPTVDKDTIRRVTRIIIDRSTASPQDDRDIIEYTRSLSYPTIVDSTDLRTMHENICDRYCRNALKLALRFRYNDDERLPRARRAYYFMARNALMACLYFYGTTETFLNTIEIWARYMREQGAEMTNNYLYDNIQRIIGSMVDREISTTVVTEQRDEARASFSAFVHLRLDLRSISPSILNEILYLFRSRCRRIRGEKMVSTATTTTAAAAEEEKEGKN